ncbi:MAG: response regulator [Solirubrobacterales bacterium]
MASSLQVLLVEDHIDDADLIKREIKRGGYEIALTRVEDRAAFKKALTSQDWDIILSDHMLPHFSSEQALSILHESGKDIPFIIVSGEIGDELAVTAMRKGCQDYIMKDNLNRLVPAIQREIQEADFRRRHAAMAQQLEMEKGLFAVTLRSIGDGVIITDPNGQIMFLNSTAERLTAWPAEEAVGCPVTEVFRLLDPLTGLKAPNPIEQVVATGQVVGLAKDTILIARDGKQQYVSASNAPIPGEKGSLRGVVVVFRDISAMKAAEEELLQAKDAAETADRYKTQFLANVSHEIRTPLNGIIGMTSLTMLSELNPEQRENLELIATSARSLLRIIDDLLDLSKIEAGRVEIKSVVFDLSLLIAGLMRPHAIQCSMKGLELKYHIEDDVPVHLYGDPDRLGQILNNLLSNGIKFTEQGALSLSVHCLRCEGGNATLQFILNDTGIGIAETEMPKLFRSFSQVDGSYTRKYGGTGLGLVISKQLVELMGGTIGVASQKGVGSTFSFTLRFEVKEVAAAPAEKRALGMIMAAPAPLNILLAEDDNINRMVVARLLSRMGHRVEEATNGFEVLEKLEKRPFDLILMDIQMPGMDGMETSRRIRKMESTGKSRIPIVALTAHAVQGDRERFLAAGMDDYIAKPFRLDDIVEAIDRLAGSKYDGNTPPSRPVQAADFGALLDYVDGDRAFMLELLNIFAEDAQEKIQALQLAVASGDWDEASRINHLVAGSSAHVFAFGIQQSTVMLSRALKEKSLVTANAALDQMAACYVDLVEKIQRL